MQHRMQRIGLFDRLEKAGVQEGDEVRILGFAFDYEGARNAQSVLEEESLEDAEDEGFVDA